MSLPSEGWARVTNQGTHYYHEGRSLSLCGQVVSLAEERTEKPQGEACAACKDAKSTEAKAAKAEAARAAKAASAEVAP